MMNLGSNSAVNSNMMMVSSNQPIQQMTAFVVVTTPNFVNFENSTFFALPFQIEEEEEINYNVDWIR